MALFGWLVLVALAVVLSVVTFRVALAQLRLRPECLPAILAAMTAVVALTWLGVLVLLPFKVLVI